MHPKATLGPWVVDDYEDGEWVLRKHGTDIEIAESRTEINNLTAKEGMANGYLISAAPDLFEACEDILFQMLSGQGVKDISKLCAALRKATNGSI